MTDDHAASVLRELHRIGVDIARLADLPASGLRKSEVVAWLRQVPDAIGHAALVERLHAHARQVDDSARSAAGPSRRPPARELARATSRDDEELVPRMFPNRAEVDAATELLIEEWDPFGVRLLGLEREQ